MTDQQYQALPRPQGGLVHHYGERVHLLSYPYAMSMLERLSSPDTVQPTANHLVGALYRLLLG